MQVPKTNNINSYITKRIYSTLNINRFINEINQKLIYNNYLHNRNINIQFLEFSNICSSSFENCFPLKKVKVKQKSWLSKGIRQSSKNKRLLLSLLSNIKPLYLQGKEIIECHIKNYCKIYNKVIKKAKQITYENKIKNSDNKIKSIWNIVKEETESKSKNVIKLDKDGTIISDAREIVNNLNTYFLSIVQQNKIKTEISKIRDFMKNSCPANNKSFFIGPTTGTEIINLTTCIKNSFSCGWDQIPSFIFKKIIVLVADKLADLINKSFEEGIFPDCLKKSDVCPIFKGGDSYECNNFRPISLLIMTSKIVEKVMYVRVENFIKNSNILSPYQHGFLKSRSTNSALFNITKDIIKHLDKKSNIYGLSCDFRKAFDSVNFDILLLKLEHYGIRGTALLWFESYLKHRLQRTKITTGSSSVYSEWGETSAGVPQGSILGPFLFLLYINDLPSNVSTASTTMFADDTFFLTQKHLINNTIDKIQTWCTLNKIKINFEKTKCIYFQQRNTNAEHPILNYNINYESKIKSLGIIIDSALNWKDNVNSLCNSLRSACYCLRVLKLKGISMDTLKMVYFSYFESRLRYGLIYWGSSIVSSKVFILQKFALRIILGLKKRESCKEYFNLNNILTFPSLFIFECLVFLYKNKSDFSFFNSNTRQNGLIIYEANNTSLFQKSILYLGPKFYNKLPVHIRSQNLRNFKSSLKQLLITKSYYSYHEFLNDDF